MRSILAFAVFTFVLLAPGSPRSAEGMDAFHRQLMEHAQKALAAKDDAQAEGLLAKILEAYPNDRTTLHLAADVFFRRGKYQEAVTAYSRMLRLNPEDSETLVRLAVSRWHLEQGYEAQAALVRALQQHRDGGTLSPETAELARRTLDGIYDDWDVLAVMQQRNDHAAQERFHTHQIDKNPEGAAMPYALRGFARHWLQRPDEARADFEKALAIGGMPEDLTAGVQQSLGEIKTAEAERAKQAEIEAAAEAEAAKAAAAAASSHADGPTEPSAPHTSSQATAQTSEQTPETPRVNVYDYFDRIDALLQRQDDSGAARVLEQARRLSLQGEEKAVYTYYRAELAWRKGDRDAAAKGFEQAAKTIRERFRRSAAQMRLAHIYAARNDAALAESYAVRSAAMLADQPWKQRQAAGFFMGLGDTAQAVAYYEKALALEPSPEKNRETFAGLAETYKLSGDTRQYHEFARKYLDTAQAEPASASEEGTAHFYNAELLAARNDKAAAYREYEAASRLVTEKYRLSEIYIKMAEYLADTGNNDEAARYAALSAALLPDQPWRNRSVAGLYGRIGRVDEAIVYTKTAIAQEPGDDPGADLELAFLHLGNKDKDGFLVNHAAYIDKLTNRIERLGKNAPREMLQELHDARRRHADMSRTWGFDSYNFGMRRKNKDYSIMTINELFLNFSLPADMHGKVYHRLNATPKSHYSGTYSDPITSQQNSWESRSNLEDSAYGILGVKINPFTPLPDLGIGVEYLYPIGSERSHDDFRVRLEYNETWGEKPRLFDSRWNYAKTYGEVVYSTRDNDFVSFGEISFGQTFSWDFDRNLLVIPHLRANWSYGGEDIPKGNRWGVEAGPALAVRKWFNEDKHNAPRSYVEVGVNYMFGVTHELENGVGFNLTFSF